jgi:glycerol kinase
VQLKLKIDLTKGSMVVPAVDGLGSPHHRALLPLSTAQLLVGVVSASGAQSF